tara:strand:+ start:5452 stop:5619 length:168 start_codon:yes stop_codon:yes gene_type:complete
MHVEPKLFIAGFSVAAESQAVGVVITGKWPKEGAIEPVVFHFLVRISAPVRQPKI